MNPRRRYRYAGPTGIVGVILLLVGLRYGAALVYGLAVNPVTAIGEIVVVVGLGGAALLYFDIWGLRSRLPGFSSSRRGVVTASWIGYLGTFAVLALVFNIILPSLLPAVQGGCSVPGCTVTAADDKTAVVVTRDAILTVDLSEAPKAAWPDMRIESSDPSILEKLAQGSRSGDPPAARFRALAPGSAMIRAVSDAGGYSFEITVDVRPRSRAS